MHAVHPSAAVTTAGRREFAALFSSLCALHFTAWVRGAEPEIQCQARQSARHPAFEEKTAASCGKALSCALSASWTLCPEVFEVCFFFFPVP